MANFTLEELIQAAKKAAPTVEVKLGPLSIFLRNPTAQEIHDMQLASEDEGEDAMMHLLIRLIQDSDGEGIFSTIKELRELPMAILKQLVETTVASMGGEVSEDEEGN